MNPAVLDLERWSIRRWAYRIGAAFLLQAGLIWLCSESAPKASLPPADPAAIHLAVDPWSTQQMQEWPGLEDPTLFALPNPRGFSGAAWLTFAPMHYELTNWSEPPRFLQLKEERLGQYFEHLVRTRNWAPLSIADKPMPRSLGPEVAVVNLPVPSQSRLHLEGEVSQRRLLAPVPLPSWPRTELLNNSIVQVLVDADGLPFSAVLLQSSGSAEADQFAVQSAREVRFQPLAAPARNRAGAQPFTPGKLVYQWHTSVVGVTNATVPLPRTP